MTETLDAIDLNMVDVTDHIDLATGTPRFTNITRIMVSVFVKRVTDLRVFPVRKEYIENGKVIFLLKGLSFLESGTIHARYEVMIE